MNKVILMGRLVRDPEVRYSQGHEPLAVARYTLAVDRRFRKQGEKEADFIGCVAFGKAGEFAEKYFKKGQLVSVIGRLQVRSWDDNEGKKRWSTDVVVEEQYFAESKGCTPKKDGDAEGGFAKQSAEQAFESRTGSAAPAPSQSGGQAPPSDGFYPAEPDAAAPEGWFAGQTSADKDVEDDDLPF